jgi:predicted house-cleaning noncanonical NTP pyrophosphatase (MazG superfamily)
MGDMEDYIKRMKELREQIDKRAQENTINQIYDDVFNLLKTLTGKKTQIAVVESFEEDFVKKGKFSPQHLRILKNVISAKTDFKKGKLDAHKVDNVRKNAGTLINDLIEFSQRKDLVNLEKGRMRIKYGKDKIAEIVNADGKTFLIKENKIFEVGNKLEDSNMEELSKAVDSQKKVRDVQINSNIFEVLKKDLGEFEVLI